MAPDDCVLMVLQCMCFYGSNEMLFSTVCRWVFSAGVVSVKIKVHLNLLDLSLKVVQGFKNC